ncbi:hypothetical protein M431DRAFT_253759 [Trichoderma harzianum CBS 226.95]|uniref:Uncharacterized protein n=1 Tax=Trichoderma harzianum CBS 226.95 TaxID=983964 RepID=A0A2T4A074_TRIHA|nr:hypothetical protein M431DRAFT_253759 [Trichoderma harzianum CBS 226.95]PTB50464.1 hypothetical protein M431DRAFT_253759 [Trichoderma harzianum CBS 226.95]
MSKGLPLGSWGKILPVRWKPTAISSKPIQSAPPPWRTPLPMLLKKKRKKEEKREKKASSPPFALRPRLTLFDLASPGHARLPQLRPAPLSPRFPGPFLTHQKKVGWGPGQCLSHWTLLTLTPPRSHIHPDLSFSFSRWPSSILQNPFSRLDSVSISIIPERRR